MSRFLFLRICMVCVLASQAFAAAPAEPLAVSHPTPYTLPPIYPQPDRIHPPALPRPMPDDCGIWIVLSDREARSHFGPKDRTDRSPAAEHISGLGSTVGLSLTAGVYLLGNRRDRDTAIQALDAALQANLLAGLIKRLAGRERPYKTDGRSRFHGPSRRYDSFPSGHTSTAFALATVLSHRQPERRWLFDSLAAMVGWSRIRKDCHFLTDVVAGAALGKYTGGRTAR
ncbi:MAG: phosphatase PAP2 family protein [Armatimonadetes bacterium]|nr:phosphatase PAP2 family protein [Armatimonadota bacterium]